jgi:hypothetical protein
MMTNTIEKAPSVTSTGGFENQTNETDSATHDGIPKAVFTVMARCALFGYSVHQMIGAGYIVSMYAYTYHAKDFADLQAFAAKLGG